MSIVTPAPHFSTSESNVGAPGGAQGTSVAAASSTNTKNTTYTELITSTANDAYGIYIMISSSFTAATNTSALVDIAIGAAGSESVIIPNLAAGWAQDTSQSPGGQKYFFPIFIPSGSRLSATAQAAVANQAQRVSVWLMERPGLWPGWFGTKVVDYGTTLASSRGTTVVGGVSAAEGSWTAISTSTTYTHHYWAAGIQCAGDTTVQLSNCVADFGIGAASSEVAVASDFLFTISTSEFISYHFPMGFYYSAKAGSRMSTRISMGTASAQSLDVILYGVW